MKNTQVEKCQGLWSDGQTLWSSGLYSLTRYTNNIKQGQVSDADVDCVMIPREVRVTGQIDIHDIAVGDLSSFGCGQQSPVFVCTAFNCMATIGENSSFRPLWQPPFIQNNDGMDRCHLNGLAMEDDKPKYVTVVSRSNEADGWRNDRKSGGAIIDIASGEPVATELSMPHSPRIYDGKLWVLDTGNGALSIIDHRNGQKTEIIDLPGFARGLTFAGRYAIIGLSRPRANEIFEGLALEDRLKAQKKRPICGVVFVDIDAGKIVERIELSDPIKELYDVAILPNTRQPDVVHFGSEEIRTNVLIGSR